MEPGIEGIQQSIWKASLCSWHLPALILQVATVGYIISHSKWTFLIVLATCTGYRALWLWLHHPSHPGSIPKSQAAQSAGTTGGPQLLSHWLLVVTTFPSPGSPKTAFPNCLPALSGHVLKCIPQPTVETWATLPLLTSFSLEHTDEIESKKMPRSPGSKALLGSPYAHLWLRQETLAGSY